VFSYLARKISEISSLTIPEWIELKATLHAIDNRQFICSECLNQYRGRKDFEMMTDKLKLTKSCESIQAKPLFVISDIGFKTCIGNYFAYWVMPWIEAYHRYQDGVMPYAGGLMEQPSKAIEILRAIDNHQAEKTEKEIKKANEASRSKQRMTRRG
jgi:hypothetical protein